MAQIKHQYFVTGTDTDAGKTFVCQVMLMAAQQKGLKTLAYKPVSAGCEETQAGLRNQDALLLQAAASEALSYDEVNPIAFKDPVAPHLAAANSATEISLDTLGTGLRHLQQKEADLLLVEGAGGWRLPLGNERFLSDLAIQHQLNVILVVGLKLGCINHALLTAEAIANDGLVLSGWVANQIDPKMDYLAQNIDSLKSLLPAPLLGVIPRLSGPEQGVNMVDIDPLIAR